MRIRSVVSLLLMFSAFCLLAQTNSAPPAVTVVVPTLVRFSGTLPVTDAKLGVTFALYKEQAGGAPLWLETQNVALDSNGHYSVNLGANHAGGIPAELFAAGEARWLGVQLEGQPEQPRVLLVSVPYAMKAADADTLGGLPASSYVTAEQLENQFTVASRQSPVSPALGTPSSITPQSDAAAIGQVTPSPCAAVTSDGTALSGYLSKFTAPCNVENSGLYQSAAGFLAVGTTAPLAPLDLELPAQTGTTGSIYGEHLIASVNPAANSAANSYAFFGEASTIAGNTFSFTGDLLGSGFIVQHNGTGTLTNGFGGNYTVINHSTGTITNAASFYGLVTNQSTGTITNGYGLEIPPPQNTGGGVFTNFYGVYVANPTGAANSWGLYTLAAKNYVSGDLGIGVTAPTQALEINGNIKIDTTGHGITYADGTVQTTASVPGTGTITKVTAGTDLTGGGSSGAVTLNLDTTKVPTLAATNSFAGLQNVTVDAPVMFAVNVTNTDTGSIGGGVQGIADNPNGTGVYGVANNGVYAQGLYGYTSSGTGVYGLFDSPSAVGSGSTGGQAIWADTSTGVAIFATSDSNNAGVFTNNSSTEPTLLVDNLGGGGTGLVIAATGKKGNCTIDGDGDLACSGALHVTLAASDHRTVEMYSVQSTENWFEDAGSGQLRNGFAVVSLDADFAALVNTGLEYHVFPVPNGDCKGLYVTNKTASGFEVREIGGGRANVAFDYRIMAKRKGMESLRLRDITEQVKSQAAVRGRKRSFSAGVGGKL